MQHSLQQSIINVFFGIAYGFIIVYKLKDRDWWMCYYFGKWRYVRKRNFIYKLIIYGLTAGLSAILFIFVVPRFVKSFYPAYFVSVFGTILAAMGVSLFTPLIARKMGFLYK